MSRHWVLKSFDRARWDEIFGGGMPGSEQMILDAMLWDNDGYFDDTDELGPGPSRDQVLATNEGQEARRLASHLADRGFTYDGLDAAQAVLLDNFGGSLGQIECLGQNCRFSTMTAWLWCMEPSFQNSCVGSDMFVPRRQESWINYLGVGEGTCQFDAWRFWRAADAMVFLRNPFQWSRACHFT